MIVHTLLFFFFLLLLLLLSSFFIVISQAINMSFEVLFYVKKENTTLKWNVIPN